MTEVEGSISRESMILSQNYSTIFTNHDHVKY